MTNKKLTDREIIKALECCKPKQNRNCSICPVYELGNFCAAELRGAALDLINRQKAEIERLKALAKNGASAIDTNNRLIQKFAETTAEAIKEFADKAVEKLTENYSSKYCRWIDDTIDSLLKEMEEEEE